MAAALMLRSISGSTFDASNRSHPIESSVQLPIVLIALGDKPSRSKRQSHHRDKAIPAPAGNGRAGIVSTVFIAYGLKSAAGVVGLRAAQIPGNGEALRGGGLLGVGRGVAQRDLG